MNDNSERTIPPSSNRVRYFVDQNYRVMDRQVNGVIARCATAEDAGTIAFSLNYTARRASGSSDETSPDSRDAARYRWLRRARAVYDDSGRFPQGEALDECCDAFMAKNQDGRQSDEPTLQGGFGPTVREPSSAQSPEETAAPETKSKWKCGADRSGIGGNMPQDCNWPYCGCDETATKVIEALQEQGWMPVPRSASMPNRVRPQESPNKSKVEYIEELASYCGFAPRYALHNLPRSRELEALLEHLANAQDDALRLHHAYVDLKYPQSAPSAQETSAPQECVHNLCASVSTLTIIDPYKAKCRVCFEFFDLPLEGASQKVTAEWSCGRCGARLPSRDAACPKGCDENGRANDGN